MLFKNTTYVSETTQFLRDYLDKNPEVAQGQLDGRALLWEQKVDADFNQAAKKSQVSQKPYVYQAD